MLKLLFSIYVVGVLGALQGCKGSKPQENTVVISSDSSAFGYNLDEGNKFVLPADLNEISGIVWLKSQPHSIYAVQDEEGVLFTYNMSANQITNRFEFAKKGDYEGVSTDGNQFFVLKSNGSIYTFPIGETDMSGVKEHKGLIPKGEYESMSFDTLTNKLYVLCKSCKEDKKEASVTGYVLAQLTESGDLELERTFSISIDAIRKLDNTMSKSFKPSAMAKSLLKNEWYILSSVDKAILVTDENFIAKEVVRFDRKTFQQPEGIGFDREGNMYISSEAGDSGQAVLYQFLPRYVE